MLRCGLLLLLSLRSLLRFSLFAGSFFLRVALLGGGTLLSLLTGGFFLRFALLSLLTGSLFLSLPELLGALLVSGWS